MSTSYNGWSASPSLATRALVVAGEAFVPGVRDDDDVWTVFHHLAWRLHNEVEPIVRDDWHQMDDWGYNYRATTGDSSTLSCHSSGTAIDYNATRHPFGVPADRNFSSAQIAKIREIISDLPIVWGGDYRNTPDAMHFEIIGSAATVRAAADRIRNSNQKDGFDMADLNDLRAIVRDEINNDAFIEKVANKSAGKVWGRDMTTTNASGATVTQNASEFLKETWTNLKVLMKQH